MSGVGSFRLRKFATVPDGSELYGQVTQKVFNRRIMEKTDPAFLTEADPNWPKIFRPSAKNQFDNKANFRYPDDLVSVKWKPQYVALQLKPVHN